MSGHREDGQVDAVELVETAPRTGLSQTLKNVLIRLIDMFFRVHLIGWLARYNPITFVDSAQTTEVHLVRTVEDDHVFAKRLDEG